MKRIRKARLQQQEVQQIVDELLTLNFEKMARDWIDRDKYDGMFLEIVVPGDKDE